MTCALNINEGFEALEERITGSERQWAGSFLRTDFVYVDLPDGTPARREVVRHPGAVAVVALDAQNRMLVVRQYRVPLERVTLEIPAGKIDAGEGLEETARRELEEETGYVAGSFEYLTGVAVAAGYSDEVIHLFLATDLRAGEAHPDEDEFVAIDWIELPVLVEAALAGKIEDSKTLVAVLMCHALQRGN